MPDLDSDDLGNVALLLKADRKRKQRSKCKSWLQKRDKLSHNVLLEELRSEPEDYLNYLRMDEPTFLELLSLVTKIIVKQDTMMRTAITPQERLTCTLRYLATGRSYEDLKFFTFISPQAL